MSYKFSFMRSLFTNFSKYIRNITFIPSVKQKPHSTALVKDERSTLSRNAINSINDTRMCVKDVSILGNSNVLVRFLLGGNAVPLTKTYNPHLNINQTPNLVMSSQLARFSTSSAVSNKKNKCAISLNMLAMQGSKGIISVDDCEGVKRQQFKKVVCPKMPPCLKFVRPPGKVEPINEQKMECGRICMPCCPKARYPPVCFFPTLKQPCCKIPNPRPAFSECNKDCVNKRKICDCCHIKPPPCRLLPDIDDTC